MTEREHEHDPKAVRRIVGQVAAASPAERAAILDRACGDDASLREQVEAALASMTADETLAGAADGTGAADASPTLAFGVVPDQQAGDQLGRYRLLEPLGEGGFGTVWAAEQREPVRRRVALKIIKLGMDTKQVIARFEAERQALAMMDHPNIAKVLDAGATETGRPYFVMELVRGVPILEYCDREKLDTRQRLDLFVTVCHAIQHAHQKGIIHRDIKPGNVLVTLHDGVPVPKVIDFGIAKATNQQLTEKTIYTQQQQMIGTPAYMSPEQAEMSGLDIDTRADIYSLGVLLYELLTGTTPFETRSLLEAGFGEMMRIIREETPHKPSTRLSSLGDTGTQTAERRRTDPRRLGLVLRGDLDWIVMRCLEKDRTRRYDTANGLAADIVRHLQDEPVEAGPPSTSYRLRKFVRRNRGQVLAGGLLVAAMVLGVIGTSVGMARANAASLRAELEATRANEEAARATQELTRAVEIKRIITRMLQSVDPAEAQLQDATMLRGILEDAAARLAGGQVADELVAAELHGIIGGVYVRLGLLPEAERHLPAAQEIRRRLLGDEDPRTLDADLQMAILRDEQGRFAEAEAGYTRVYEARRRIEGPDAEGTVRAMNALATLHMTLGRLEDAEPLLRESLVRRTERLGPEAPATLIAASNLAATLEYMGRIDEAEALYLRTLEIQRRGLSDGHPDTQMTMTNLAVLYAIAGRFADAEPLMRETIAMQERVLGEDHPETLASVHNLAALLDQTDRFEDAEAMYRPMLARRRAVLGADHPDTQATVLNLGLLYDRMDRPADAAVMLEECLPVLRESYGPDHPFTEYAIDGLARATLALGRRDDAVALRRELLAIDLATAEGPDAPAEVLDRAAGTMIAPEFPELRDPARAVELARRAVAAAEATGVGGVRDFRQTLARAQFENGDPAAAVLTQRRAMETPAERADPAMAERLAEFEAAAEAEPAADGDGAT